MNEANNPLEDDLNNAPQLTNHITMDDLESLDACKDGKELFYSLFKNSMEINETNVERALTAGLPFDWLLEELHLLTSCEGVIESFKSLRTKQNAEYEAKYQERRKRMDAGKPYYLLTAFLDGQRKEISEMFKEKVPELTAFLNNHYFNALGKRLDD